MRFLLAISAMTALCGSVHAGIVQGVVQEYSSGYALARTVVRLVPVPRADNVNLKEHQMRSGSAGQFLFAGIPDGYYFLISTRNGYFPGAYGQRRPNGQGTPILIGKDTDLFAQLRMHRKGAITGRVLDENNVGIEGVPVVAYRARLPLRIAGEGTSDDRGVYRIHGLDSGSYWIRSTAHTLEDGSGILPTFGPQSREVREARALPVRLDEDTTDADVHPEFGALFRLTGELQCIGGEAKVTLTSETLHRVTQSGCASTYTFISLPPAVYEITAETLDGKQSGYTEVFADKNMTVPVKLAPPPTVRFETMRAGSRSFTNIPVTIVGRRQDLYDSETPQQIPTPTAGMVPGHWELSADAGPDQYIESISNFRGGVRRDTEPEKSIEWFDVFIEMGFSASVRITVSDKAAQISGTVTNEGKPVPGAPVFLWPVDENSRRSLRGYKMVFANTDGKYQAVGLPPGDYRILATYDFTEIDEAGLDEASAGTIHAEPSQITSADLTLWVSP